MSQLVESRELRETEQTEGIAVQCLTFQRAGHERAGKAFADSRRLGEIKIAAATFGDGPQPFELFL